MDIQTRTRKFSLRIIALYASLPPSVAAQVIGKQALRSGTSIGAHVREGKHSRSAAEMFSKVSVALQEAEEARYWLDLLSESGIVCKERLQDILREADTIVAILFASTKTLKRNSR
jgi:four helix bundle protein